jgi:hypothetical protein
MKTKAIVITFLGILLVGTVVCGGSGILKPSVGNVPAGWSLSDEEPYGTYEELDGTKWGMIDYTDGEDGDFVQIFYGDVPSSLKGKETDEDALIARAAEEAKTFEADETGTMYVSGWLAGYAKAYDSSLDLYDMEVVFVEGTTCIDIYAVYDAGSENESQVTSIINSISF